MTDPVGPPRRWMLAVVLVALACPGRAGAQAWGAIELPGGVAAARTALNLGNDSRTPGAFLVDFIRTAHQFGDVDSTVIDRFQRYLEYVQELRAKLAVWPDGLFLGSDRLPRQTRDRWRNVAEQLGLRLREVANRPVLEVDRGDEAAQRAIWLEALGIDVPQLVQQLNLGQRVRLDVGVESLPLPAPEAWPAVLDRPGRPDIIRLGVEHRPALLYVALMALDGETLEFFAAHPRLLELDTATTGTLAAFAGSLHVRGGQVAVPGGAAYAPVWVQLVDRRLDQPEDFIRRLLERDDGRLAFLYDTVAHLSPSLQTALFDGTTTTTARIDAIERHLRPFKAIEPGWTVGVRPFYRPGFDPGLAMTMLDVAPDGTVGPSWWPRLFEAITDDDGWPDRPLKQIEERRAGLGWVVGWMFERDDAPARFQLLRFAQRRFRDAPRAAAGDVEVALRGVARMPSLLLVLERLEAADAPTLARLAQAAVRLTAAGDVDRVGPLLLRWQSALSVLEQVARRRALPPDTIQRLLQALADLVPQNGVPPADAVAGWVIEQLNPALGGPPARSDFEPAAIAAWLAPERQPSRTMSWEGLDYRVDRVGPVVRDATATRGATKGPTLGHLEVLVRTRREMAAGVTTLEAAKDIAGRLESVRRALLDLRDDRKAPRFQTGDLSNAARTIARIRKPKDLTRVARQVSRLDDAFDDVTGYVLPALAYALAAAPVQQPQIYADAADRHLITGTRELQPGQWRLAAWRLPRSGTLPAGGSGVVGAMLALDTVLADGQLRRAAAAAGGLPSDRKLNPADADALMMRLLFASPLDEVDAAGPAALAAVADGRQRWAAIAGRPRAGSEAALMSLLGPIRGNLVLWLRERDQAAAADALVLPSELARLGLDEGGALPRAFGVSSFAFDGCLCLRAPIAAWPITEWTGRGDAGHLSLLGADLALRLAQALADLALPPFLMELVLPMALQDQFDRVNQFSTSDWEALTDGRFVTRTRVEEYLLALVAEGVLAPPSSAPPGGERR
ncbi:MAG: hypothetical protein R2745_16060 [Vicinamibacterales bacterium]